MTFDVEQFKRAWPMPKLMDRIGLGDYAKARCRSPFREDKNPSWGIFQKDGVWLFKDLATGDSGDEISLVARWKGLNPKADFQAVVAACEEIAGTRTSISRTTAPSRAPFDWQRCVDAFGAGDGRKLAEERGYSPEFASWLHAQRMVGLHGGGLAFPVHDEAGSVIGCHHKNGNGWNVRPNEKQAGYKIPLNPLIIGDPSAASQVFAFESQWDAFAVMDRLGWHDKPLAETTVIVTRGAGNGKRLGPLSAKAAAVYAFAQNDKAGKDWLAAIAKAAQCRTHAVETPAPHKDPNDWTRAGADRQAVFDAIESAKIVPTEERLGEEEPPVADSLGKQIETRRFDIRNQPPIQPARYHVAGVPICTTGNLSAITAGIKSGKSSWIAAMVAAVMAAGQSMVDCLGITSSNPEGLALIHIDTEQSIGDHWQLVHRSVRRAGLNEPPQWLMSYALKGFTAHQLREAINLLIDEAKVRHGGIHSVILDGTADFVLDVNDPGETNPFVASLETLAVVNNCPIVNVIHFNPNSDKTRGHLGSQLERKAETNLRLDKDGETITVWSEKNRQAPILKSAGPCFTWSDEHMMHVSIAHQESPERRAKNLDDLVALLPVDGAIPQTVMFERARTASIGEKKCRAFLDELLESGRLHIWKVKRPGTNDAKHISRHPQPEPSLALK